MTYVPPYLFKCGTCGYTMQHLPKVVNLTIPTTRDSLHCPECWRKFLQSNIGVMKPAVPTPPTPRS